VFDDNWAAPARWILVNRKWPPADVDFQLGEGTLVHGTVTSEPDGKPLVGSLIVQDSQASESARWVSTDQNGTYRVRLAPGEYFISLGTNKSQVETIAVGSEKTIRKDLRLKQPQS
jgi:Carboxypeptidase regulatory-like domain